MKKIVFSTALTKKNRELRDYLIGEIGEYTELSKSKILDIGCGNGRFGILLHKFVKEYYGIDPDKDYIRLAVQEKGDIANIHYKLGKAEKIPFKNKFDVILFPFSWHFIKDYDRALRELSRISGKDSLIVIIEPSLVPEGYSDSRLNANSKQFVNKLWNRKLKSLKRAIGILKSQKYFKVIKSKKNKSNLWLLRRDY